MKIAIDAMGGDFAPLEPVKGAIEAIKMNLKLEVILVGDQEKINNNHYNDKDICPDNWIKL